MSTVSGWIEVLEGLSSSPKWKWLNWGPNLNLKLCFWGPNTSRPIKVETNSLIIKNLWTGPRPISNHFIFWMLGPLLFFVGLFTLSLGPHILSMSNVIIAFSVGMSQNNYGKKIKKKTLFTHLFFIYFNRLFIFFKHYLCERECERRREGERVKEIKGER